MKVGLAIFILIWVAVGLAGQVYHASRWRERWGDDVAVAGDRIANAIMVMAGPLGAAATLLHWSTIPRGPYDSRNP